MTNRSSKVNGSVLSGLALIVIIVFLVGVFSPSTQQPYDDTSLKYVGRQRLLRQLKDPDSFKIIEEKLIRPGLRGGKVGYYCKFRAKNSFNSYTIDEFYTE